MSFVCAWWPCHGLLALSSPCCAFLHCPAVTAASSMAWLGERYGGWLSLCCGLALQPWPHRGCLPGRPLREPLHADTLLSCRGFLCGHSVTDCHGDAESVEQKAVLGGDMELVTRAQSISQ